MDLCIYANISIEYDECLHYILKCKKYDLKINLHYMQNPLSLSREKVSE